MILCARIGTGSSTVLCMVIVAESTHFDRLANLFRYRREPLTFVRSGNSGTSVVHVNIVARLLYIHVLGVAETRL